MASLRRKPCTARVDVLIAAVIFCLIPVLRPNASAPTRLANEPEKLSGSETNWPPIPITEPTKETANKAGNTSIPIIGASIANSVRITAHATGFCNSTGTTNAVSVRLQRWRY